MEAVILLQGLVYGGWLTYSEACSGILARVPRIEGHMPYPFVRLLPISILFIFMLLEGHYCVFYCIYLVFVLFREIRLSNMKPTRQNIQTSAIPILIPEINMGTFEAISW